MKRLLLNTNIYGELILDSEFLKLKERIKKKFAVHGFKIIRTYDIVNSLEKIKTPNFIGYLEFKRWLI